MKRITGKYNLSKDDPHYKTKTHKAAISPKAWITKTYFESRQSEYIIRFRCADRVMKITQVTHALGSPNPKKRTFVVAPGNDEYEKYYSCYKVARRIKS